MCAMKNNEKRNSLPSLTMNKFFVNKRASMFEKVEEAPPPGNRNWREWSPCGLVESSQKKLEEKKEKQRKEMMRARLKRQADPYAEESSDQEDDDEGPASVASEKDCRKDSKACGHASRSVNFGQVKKTLKQGQAIGECTQCRKGHCSELDKEPNPIVDNYVPVIWLCLYCGHQGCDRNTQEQHALLHYRRPHSDPHCLILNTQAWNVWCYECDSEVHQTSSKKLHEVVEFIKRQKDMAPRRSTSNRPLLNSSQFGTGGECGTVTVAKGSISSFDDNSKAAKNQRNAQASVLASLPKVKGLSNLGNTCFFNSVMQSLSQTHFLTQLLDLQCQSGQRVYLPGRTKPPKLGLNGEVKQENGRVKRYSSENEDEDDVELKPLDLYLPEGGGLTLATATLLKEMHSVGKNSILNPGYLFGQLHGMDASICKKSTQFQGYEQQDAHELLRCLLEAIRNEEILRAKRAILKAFALSEKTDPNTVSPRLKTMIKGYGRQATHTIVDQIFGGQLISTIFCEECHWSSQVFEPMMDLSLPINEEKGKLKKNQINDETVVDCFGRPTSIAGGNHNMNNNTAFNTHSNHRGNTSLSKHQLKKQKKAEKKQRRGHKGRGKGGSLAPSCIKANNEDDELAKSEKLKRRMTEKSHAGDQEDLARAEEARKTTTSDPAGPTGKRGESSRFKQLMAARKGERVKDSGQEDGSEEDSEYDFDEDEEEDSLGGQDKPSTKNGDEKKDPGKGEKTSRKEEEDEDEDSEEDDSEETESEGKGNDSDGGSSKKKGSSTETSDADIEDNTDSDRVRHKYHNTRQPSIVVEQSETETRGSNEGLVPNHKCLNTCYSSDQLNYNSASDTSERYYTPYEKDCNGLDTADDLDNYQDPQDKADTTSLRSDNTTNSGNSGKGSSTATGDTCSISSGETIGNFDLDPKVPVDQAHMDEMCLKVKELKIRRKSCSKESLLEATPKTSQKRGSTETLHTFNEKPEEEEDESVKKAKFLKKLKQEWIARSLTTLAPRYQCRSQECSVMSCLTHFTAPELLTGNNKITCENCTKIHNQLHPDDPKESVKSNASKQMLILSPPAVLTLQLKRFHHMGFNLAKVNRYVKFPLVLDIAPFTSSISLGLGNMSQGQSQVLYGLYGVVEHSGRLNSGHYVAYVRSRPLDPNHTNRQYLNLKPSSQFEIDHLVAEMAEKVEASSGTLHRDFKASPGSSSANVQEFEEEIKAGRWFHVSDTYVAEVNIDRVLKSQAYLLFYERLV
ncbi:ubiquitin carboxyl-terminal hydrolase 16-like isoform X4 [Eriocheir sinensis]|uniref:ubiquitin carboxyl-terminal hydrolase 16-like isoform X4 n=1 Tax=Eriocheir sinensis TaxID=95602 RepID=UPI0021C705B1|nr:ubiquitin carboxyl-terminal hydrolase 16-like isoform X4 [Eriocheir sinensis]